MVELNQNVPGQGYGYKYLRDADMVSTCIIGIISYDMMARTAMKLSYHTYLMIMRGGNGRRAVFPTARGPVTSLCKRMRDYRVLDGIGRYWTTDWTIRLFDYWTVGVTA